MQLEALEPIDADTKLTPQLFISDTWWDAYGRDDLDALVVSAILNNLELKAEADRLNASRQIVKQQFANELPQVSIGANWTRQKNSNTLIQPDPSQFQGSGPRIFAPGSTYSIYNLPLTVDYELDVFGKNRNATKAEGARYQAEIFKLRDKELALAEQAVMVGMQSLQTDAMLRLTKDRLTVQQELFHLESVRLDAGLDAEDPTLERQQIIDQLTADIARYQETSRKLDHEAALLVGMPIKSFTWKNNELRSTDYFEHHDLSGYKAWLKIDSNRLINRPDVQVQEALMQAAGFDVKVARRMFLPTFSLSASVGLASTQLNQWFDWNSILASFTAGVAQKLFTGGALKANLKQQESLYNAMGKTYQQTLLNAGKSAEDAIVTLDNAFQQMESLENQLTMATRLMENRDAQYQAGSTSYVQVLEQRDRLLHTETSFIQERANVLLAWNTLQRELGASAS